MDYKYIEQLLEKYWECETTLQEENILRAFFQQADIPAHLRAFQPLFACHSQQAGLKLPAGVEQQVMAATGQAEQEPAVHCLPLRTHVRFRPIYKAAGMVGVVLTLSMAVQHSLQPTDPMEGQPVCTEQATTPDTPYAVTTTPERQSATVSSLPDDTLKLLQITSPGTGEQH